MTTRVPQPGIFASVTAGVTIDLDVSCGELRRPLERAVLSIFGEIVDIATRGRDGK